jgi:hypothetical protein
MKKIFLLWMLLSSMLLSAQHNVFFVAVKTGLNMRDKPDAAGKVLDKIPYGARVTLQDNNEERISIKTEGLLGYWRKVNYNSKTGYILDSYLFPLPPPKATVKTLQDYLAQVSTTFGNKLTVKTGDEETGAQLHKQLYKDGNEWHKYEGYEYGSDTYFLQGFSLQQAFLLLRMVPEFEKVVAAKDEFPRTSKKIKKGDIDYDIRVETELFTEEPWIKRITIQFEEGAIYNFEMYEVDNQVVIFYGSGV